MTIMQQIDALGAEMIAAVEEDALTDLAELVAEQSARSVQKIMDAMLARVTAEHRQQDEQARMRAMLDAARLPGVDMPVAPARGPMRRVTEYDVTRGGMRVETGAHWRRVDQLTAMCRQAWLRHDRNIRVSEPFVPPFTTSQIAMGQRYQALVERHSAAGLRCASAEAQAVAVSGGDGRGFMEAYMSESRELSMIYDRIGMGVALPVKRASGKRRPITDRVLVDAVCLAGKDLTTILREHGWSKDARRLNRLREALAAALDRMQGYR